MTGDWVIFRSGKRLCGLPVGQVVETMRPLPIDAVPHAPRFVSGMSTIRGQITPVIDLRRMLGDDASSPPRRLLRVLADKKKSLGLLVDEVVGVRPAPRTSEDVPGLLQDAAMDVIEALARLDGQILLLLRAGKLLPDDLVSSWVQEERS